MIQQLFGTCQVQTVVHEINDVSPAATDGSKWEVGASAVKTVVISSSAMPMISQIACEFSGMTARFSVQFVAGVYGTKVSVR